jgi:hypothetical protein
LNDAQLAVMNHTIQTDPTAKAYFEGMYQQGLEDLKKPLLECGGDGASLGVARSVLGEEYRLALLWRLTGDHRFASRATQQLLHVTTNCTSWDPYGLILGEMTHAVGIGYDWLYHYLTPTQRQAIVAGVLRLGFDEALMQQAKNHSGSNFWTNCTFNWVSVRMCTRPCFSLSLFHDTSCLLPGGRRERRLDLWWFSFLGCTSSGKKCQRSPVESIC